MTQEKPNTSSASSLASSSEYETVQEIADYFESQFGAAPKTACILGSGLGAFGKSLESTQSVTFADIPHIPQPEVSGHAGQLMVGTVAEVPVAVLSGRVHYYEGHGIQTVVRLARSLAQWGVDRFIVTNSAGGLNPEFNVGDLMLLSDHLNMMGINPLLGENDDRFGPRFPDMSFAYHPQLRVAMLEAAQAADIKLQTGVYCALSGPSYETPAEIRMFRTLGADAVGMSTVPEIIALNHMQKACVGMSLITNLAAGISDTKLTHEEVKETAAAATQKIIELLKSAIVKIDRITLDS